MKNSDQPIYPILITNSLDSNKPSGQYMGMTKREYFAARALQGILSNSANSNMEVMGVNTAGPFGFIAANFAAKEAVVYANELLKALEQ